VPRFVVNLPADRQGAAGIDAAGAVSAPLRSVEAESLIWSALAQAGVAFSFIGNVQCDVAASICAIEFIALRSDPGYSDLLQRLQKGLLVPGDARQPFFKQMSVYGREKYPGMPVTVVELSTRALRSRRADRCSIDDMRRKATCCG